MQTDKKCADDKSVGSTDGLAVDDGRYVTTKRNSGWLKIRVTTRTAKPLRPRTDS